MQVSAILLAGLLSLVVVTGCDKANSKEGEDCVTDNGMTGHFSANGVCSIDEMANSPET
ncbi:hypothetical protein [Phytohalomonas tamaricis]|uniref:hypothetical protein n=1 Tax=Phytohalomonas tamaricis TaxID=2081032 RepID=UPI00131A2974|nr:hypothetical protein [Phytohalomonas tamaricis]